LARDTHIAYPFLNTAPNLIKGQGCLPYLGSLVDLARLNQQIEAINVELLATAAKPTGVTF